jgi:hypothetical protein
MDVCSSASETDAVVVEQIPQALGRRLIVAVARHVAIEGDFISAACG